MGKKLGLPAGSHFDSTNWLKSDFWSRLLLYTHSGDSRMRIAFALTVMAFLAGCSTHGVVHYSPYDLDRNGVLDARCPGMEYDTSDNTLFGWRSRASGECADQAPMEDS
jgi:hypothetical protein